MTAPTARARPTAAIGQAYSVGNDRTAWGVGDRWFAPASYRSRLRETVRAQIRLTPVDHRSLRWRLNKPYYLFRPGQIVRRLASAAGLGPPPGIHEIQMPWGVPLALHTDEQIGRCVVRRGVFDLAVTETLYRLADPGELAVDVGANVGHMTSVLARRLGQEGRVLAFEPHPDIAGLLRQNAGRWAADRRLAQIELHELALSDTSGHATLAMKPAFRRNMGSASLAVDAEGLAAAAVVTDVAVDRLDDVVGNRSVGVLKVDVEGHELQVFRGASALIARHGVRDIVFEEFESPPTPVTDLLTANGYTILSLDQALLGPTIGPLSRTAAGHSLEDPSYLATTDPARATSRLQARGWAVLGRLHHM